MISKKHMKSIEYVFRRAHPATAPAQFVVENPTIPRDVVTFALKEARDQAILSGVYWYARKKPLTFAARVITHTVPYVSMAFWAYDAYTLADSLLND